MTLDNIWFTYKARIRAQVRLAKNDFHSQALLVWYAFCGAVLAVVAIRFPQILGSQTDILAAVFSIALLVVSLMVTGRDFRGRAMEMQRNYLALQSLYRRAQQNPPVLSLQEIENQYGVLLDQVENHTTLDDVCARVFETGRLTSRHPSLADCARAWGYMAARTVILLSLYALPVAVTLSTFTIPTILTK
ncbi:SLATT domain-containing protein [Cupriavidus sp. JZ107]